MMNKTALLIRSPLRIFRYVFVDRDYRHYYSAEGRERAWREEHPDFSGVNEDPHYGALSESLLVRIDYSATAVENASARALPNCRFHCADFQSYTPDSRFSVVVFNESIYYIEDIGGAIRRAESWLDDRGVLV